LVEGRLLNPRKKGEEKGKAVTHARRGEREMALPFGGKLQGGALNLDSFSREEGGTCLLRSNERFEGEHLCQFYSQRKIRLARK